MGLEVLVFLEVLVILVFLEVLVILVFLEILELLARAPLFGASEKGSATPSLSSDPYLSRTTSPSFTFCMPSTKKRSLGESPPLTT